VTTRMPTKAGSRQEQERGTATKTMTWALVIATCNRREILPECLRLAAEQTRPPSEIIVIDASEDWQVTRDRIMSELAPKHPPMRWIYDEAERRSLPFQRNQGAQIASADVLFMIDDDSMMAPDAAEKIMAVYQADTRREVAAVRLARGPLPEHCRLSEEARSLPTQPPRPRGRISGWVRRALNADNIGIPYDPHNPPRNVVPDHLAALNVTAVPSMVGYAMTARRELVLREPFEPTLEAYAAGEDSDFGERIKRHGSLLMACDAYVHHLEVGGGRLPVKIVTALGAMNPMVLHRLYSTDPVWACRRMRTILWRRLLIEGLKDIHRRDWSMPRLRGIRLALRRYRTICQLSPEDIRTWYPDHQRSLLRQ